MTEWGRFKLVKKCIGTFPPFSFFSASQSSSRFLPGFHRTRLHIISRNRFVYRSFSIAEKSQLIYIKRFSYWLLPTWSSFSQLWRSLTPSHGIWKNVKICVEIICWGLSVWRRGWARTPWPGGRGAVPPRARAQPGAACWPNPADPSPRPGTRAAAPPHSRPGTWEITSVGLYLHHTGTGTIIKMYYQQTYSGTMHKVKKGKTSN